MTERLRRPRPPRVRSRHALGFVLAAAALALSGMAAADDPPPLDASGPKRALPNYDGRPPAEPGAGRVLLWMPRAVVFPLFVVSEYVLRRPGGWTADKLEDLHADASGGDSFGITPAFEIETDRRPMVGVTGVWRNAGMRSNELSAHAGFGGTDWLRAILANRVLLDQEATLRARLEARRRPDLAFFGLGPDAPEALSSRYREDRLDAAVAARLPVISHVVVAAEVGARRVRFGAATCCGEPSLPTRVGAGELELPTGFVEGYIRWHQGIGIGIDSRREAGSRATGAALGADGARAMNLESPGRWALWGGRAEAGVDVTGTGRHLALDVDLRFANPLGRAGVPWSELPTLGGDGPMRGYLDGRLRGRSATAATVRYRYPLWPMIEAFTEIAVGNAWGEHLEGWSLARSRLSGAIGIRNDDDGNQRFELLAGVGTEPFDRGASLGNARVLVALTPRF